MTVSTAFCVDYHCCYCCAATIAEGAANGSEYDVTISGRTLTGGKFNAGGSAWRLIHTISVRLSVVMLSSTVETVEGDDVKFALELDKIPANEPFISEASG